MKINGIDVDAALRKVETVLFRTERVVASREVNGRGVGCTHNTAGEPLKPEQ